MNWKCVRLLPGACPAISRNFRQADSGATPKNRLPWPSTEEHRAGCYVPHARTGCVNQMPNSEWHLIVLTMPEIKEEPRSVDGQIVPNLGTFKEQESVLLYQGQSQACFGSLGVSLDF